MVDTVSCREPPTVLSDPRNPYPVVHEMGIPTLADIVDYTNIYS